MKLSDLKNTGHWPTLLAAFFVFRLQLYGLGRAWTSGSADWRNAASFARAKGLDGRTTDHSIHHKHGPARTGIYTDALLGCKRTYFPGF